MTRLGSKKVALEYLVIILEGLRRIPINHILRIAASYCDAVERHGPAFATI
jgi:hypothetical protein